MEDEEPRMGFLYEKTIVVKGRKTAPRGGREIGNERRGREGIEKGTAKIGLSCDAVVRCGCHLDKSFPCMQINFPLSSPSSSLSHHED